MSSAEKILMNEYKELSKEKWLNIELNDDNVLDWTVALIVLNPDSIYYGGYFKARLTFTSSYPYSPPEFKFIRPLFHPNVYPDGRLCISILHTPGEDESSGELASERWSPAQRVETVLISVLSLLDDANSSSPANVDASVMFRDHFPQYKERAKQDVDNSRKDIPEGFVMPTHESVMGLRKTMTKDMDDEEFWAQSDEDMDDEEGDDEDDFLGGSDSDAEMTVDDDGDGVDADDTGSEIEEEDDDDGDEDRGDAGIKK